MQPHSVFNALQLAVSPVIMISACGLLLLSMTNRLGRAIDRARMLIKDSRSEKKNQIEIIVRRARWIRSAILFNALCISLTALLILILFVSIFLPFDITLMIGLLFITSIACLGISLFFFIIDIFSSLRAMEADIADLS